MGFFAFGAARLALDGAEDGLDFFGVDDAVDVGVGEDGGGGTVVLFLVAVGGAGAKDVV